MLVFLGTGGDSYVVGKQLRASGGFVLQVDENQFHIDPGPNALQRAKECGVNLRATTAIFVSSNSIFHANDVNAVIDAMTYSGFDKNGVLVASKSVFQGNESQSPYLQNFYRGCLERTISMEAGKRIGINDVEVQAMPARNADASAIGFKFFTPYFTLAYSSDTKYSIDVAEAYKGSHILILNVPTNNKKHTGFNLSTEDAVKFIQKVQPRLAIIQHFGIDMVKSDPIYEAREIQRQTNVQTIAAKDGMTLNPLSYAVDQGQRTLHAFPKKELEKSEAPKPADVEEIISDTSAEAPDSKVDL